MVLQRVELAVVVDLQWVAAVSAVDRPAVAWVAAVQVLAVEYRPVVWVVVARVLVVEHLVVVLLMVVDNLEGSSPDPNTRDRNSLNGSIRIHWNCHRCF
mgnify:CR=1 FL=1